VRMAAQLRFTLFSTPVPPRSTQCRARWSSSLRCGVVGMGLVEDNVMPSSPRDTDRGCGRVPTTASPEGAG